MRLSGKWAAEKLDYLARYIDVFEKAMHGKWPIRYFVDLLAGPGKNRVRDSNEILLGSPLRALTTKYPFTGYFFVDIKEQNTGALQLRCNASPRSSLVHIHPGNCNILVDEIVTEIKKDDWRSLNLAFLDPQGLELHWETVEKLSKIRRMDLIINYPEGGLNRYMWKAVEEVGITSVDIFFGTRAWREIYKHWQGKKGLHRHLIDLCKENLKSLGYQVRLGGAFWNEPLMRNTKTRAPLYRLLFASKHPLGDDLWEKVNQRDAYGQRRLPLSL